MRTFVQKPKQARQKKPTKSAKFGRTLSRQNHDVHAALHLQRTIGYQAVQRLLKAGTEDLEGISASNASTGFVLDFSRIPVYSNTPNSIQPKLKVNAPGDIYEQEANRTAAQVVNMRNVVAPQPIPREKSCEEKEADVQSNPLAAIITPLIQRETMHEEDEEPIQTKLSLSRAEKGGFFESSNRLETRLSSKSGGSLLPGDVRTFMEPRFGADFSQVRVHTDSDAIRMNRALNAQAFTHKQNIYFGAGKSAGKDALTAHELTHVLQQTGVARSKEAVHIPRIQREVQVRPPGRGEASAFDRRHKLVARLNAQSAAIRYRLVGQILQYEVVDESLLTNFDQQMKGFIDQSAVVPMRLVTSAGYVSGRPINVDSWALGYVDLDDLLASDNLIFQTRLIHILAERSATRNYERRIGTFFEPPHTAAHLREFNRAHRTAFEAEAELFRDILRDPTIRFLYREPRPNGNVVTAFQSDEGYRIFKIGHAARRPEVLTAEVKVLTRDRRWLTFEQFRTERAAAAAPVPAAP
jgi:hypothetical protein